MKISFVLPVFSLTKQSAEMAERCIESLSSDRRPDEIVVVDDASWVQLSSSTDIDVLIKNGHNLGYVKTTNIGLRAATGDVIIVGNSDLVFSHGWFDSLVDLLPTYDIAALRTSEGGRIEGTEDRIEEDGRFGPLFAIKRSAYEKLGGLDERFVHFCSDNDYRRRAIQAGLRVGMNHRFLLEHGSKGTYRLTDPANALHDVDWATWVSIYGYAD